MDTAAAGDAAGQTEPPESGEGPLRAGLADLGWECEDQSFDAELLADAFFCSMDEEFFLGAGNFLEAGAMQDYLDEVVIALHCESFPEDEVIHWGIKDSWLFDGHDGTVPVIAESLDQLGVEQFSTPC
ncbi:hypothetical protein GCG21_10460 [Pseudactinotalea sp. HY160]|uniref:hypothetical protein n=1 Tax=Pseudactinotalea sp. HY160 TaxID=2654490 RepID=UPI00128C0E68|nr:hypothetical protein [Pseudactinotalea sp. HY160]MPV50416.1 hypothetical protein [Pseudactinotalea sp. HY160]